MDDLMKITTFVVILSAGCAGTSSQLAVPPVVDPSTGVHQPGMFVWHDLLTDDETSVRSFYGALFDWEFEKQTSDDKRYVTIMREGVPIGGIVEIDPVKEGTEYSQWMSYLSVPDVDEAAELVQSRGGKLIREPWDLPGRGRVAIVSDPQGALIALLRSDSGDPAPGESDDHDWFWIELFADDPAEAITFYRRLVGYTHDTVTADVGAGYDLLRFNAAPRAGVIKNPWPQVRPNWLPYIRVKDPAETANRARKLGGSVILTPDESIRKGTVAIIADPSGAAFAVQKWPIE